MKSLDHPYIKHRRLELEKTLQDMADALGMKNASTYMKYENGTYAFKAEHLLVLANALKCKITDLFFSFNVAKTATYNEWFTPISVRTNGVSKILL